MRTIGLLILILALLGSLAVTVSRLSGSEAYVPVLLVSFTPYATLVYAVALVVAAFGLVRTRRRLGGAVALLSIPALVLHLTWAAPAFTAAEAGSEDVAAGEAAVTVLSVNVRKGRADPDALGALIREVGPDILVLQEVQPPLTSRLDDLVPADLPRVAGSGYRLDTQIFSDLASPGAEELGLTLGGWRTQLDLGGQTVEVFGVHPFSPALDVEAWRSDHARLAREAAQTRGPALIVGDLNAGTDHPPMRRLQDDGFVDAAEAAGAGWQPTFPAGSWLPPLITIDHVLARGDWSVGATRTHEIPGTDHLALEVDLSLS